MMQRVARVCQGWLILVENDSHICIQCLKVFNMKWKKNKYGSRKVVGQATMLAKPAP